VVIIRYPKGIWSSDATGVATVDQNGLVTAVAGAGGTATISYTIGGSTYGSISITVSSQNTTGTLASASQTICYNTQPANISYTTAPGGTAVTGQTITYQWYKQNGTIAAPTGDFAIGSWLAVSGATTANLSGATIGSLTTTTTFALRVISKVTNGATVSTCYDKWAGNAHLVTVRPQFTAGAINTTGQTICYNTTPSNIGSTTAASGGDNSITYSWRSSVDGYTAAISGATADNYTPGALTATTTFRRYAKDATCNTTPTQSTGEWTVTVRPTIPTPTASATLALCADPTNPYAELTGTAPTPVNGITVMGTWTVTSGSGTFSDANDKNSTISITSFPVKVKWTFSYDDNNPGCPVSSSEQTITASPTSLNLTQISLANSGSGSNNYCRSCYVKDGKSYTYYDNTGKIIATITDPSGNGEMGASEVCIGYDYAAPTAPTAANVKTVTTSLGDQQPYLPRYWSINPTTKTGQTVSVTLYFTSAELSALASKSTTTPRYTFTTGLYATALAMTKYPNGQGGSFTAPASADGVNVPIILNTYNSDGYKVSFLVNTFSTFYIHPQFYPFAPLPVELVSFTGWNQGSVNQLQWITASELNTDKFEVEKSTVSGVWNTIGSKTAAGNSNIKLTYNFTDNNPVVGDNYYRLK
jgi:hypothetical protein